MVKKYLEKTKQEFIDHRMLLLDKITSSENHIKENDKIIQFLQDGEDPNYDAFTPREINSFNRDKIAELQEEKRELSEELGVLQDRLDETDFRIADITSVIRETDIQYAESVDDIDNMYDTRRALLQSVETERQRIARDLHDSTTQNLTALVHKTELCTRLIEADPVRCKLELYNIGKSLRKIIEDTRGLIYDLRPMSFDDIGFDVTVERFLDKLKKSNGMICSYHIEGEPYPFDSVIQITLLRVIQEACNNAIKHADASKFDVKISYQKSSIVLTITDNGKGFDTSSISESTKDDNSGFGLSIMRERIYLLSGKLSIKSSLGNGCTITVMIPNTDCTD
jgi:two-component system sensor histidine kinase DegS